MSFPLNPINGQTTVTNNISYVYSSANTSWTRVPATLSASTGSSSGGGGGTVASGTGTTTTFVIQNITQSTSTNTGALQVWGGIGLGGNISVGGNVQYINSQTGIRAAYSFYNTATNSIDTVFG